MKLSDQFLKDYRQMAAQGVEFTPEDIVLLNALSVKTQRSSTAARDVHLPRLAFMPRDSWWREPIVLREPTVAHDLWMESAVDVFRVLMQRIGRQRVWRLCRFYRQVLNWKLQLMPARRLGHW